MELREGNRHFSEGKRPHPTTGPVLLYPYIRMFIAMKEEKDEFCVFRLVVRRPQ